LQAGPAWAIEVPPGVPAGSNCAAPQSAGVKTRMSLRANPQDNALTQTLGEPATVATTSIAACIIAACGIRPSPTSGGIPAAAPDHPTQPHTTHEFSKASGNLLRGSQNGQTESPSLLNFPSGPRNEFPPVIPQRVALQQSPLALGRPHHIVNPNRRALPINSSTRTPNRLSHLSGAPPSSSPPRG
jgi:hypothetical protein